VTATRAPAGPHAALTWLAVGRYRAGMMVKLVVLYTQPDDPAAFEEHYLDG
jgi:hypothetical protein